MIALERFLDKVVERDGCWEWTGCTTRTAGYGLFWYEGRLQGAHRVSYEMFVGPISGGKHVCHKCDNRACVNPEHLFAGTHQDNMRDRNRKGRQARGERVSTGKLTADQVRRIRDRFSDGERQADLAREFAVSRSSVYEIVHGKTWSHI